MKRIISLLLCLLLASLAGSAFAEESLVPFAEQGFTLRFADGEPALQGTFYYENVGQFSTDISAVYFYYIALPEARFEELISRDALSEAEQDELYGAIGTLGEGFVIGGGKGLAGLEALYRAYDQELDTARAAEFGSVGDWSWFYVDEFDESLTEVLGGDYAADYAAFRETLKRAFAEADCYEPKAPYSDQVGKKVSFETTNLDGSAVTSEELFGAHAYTMVNLWASWCGPCIQELGELGAIHKELAEQDCGIVGILTDGDEPGAPEKARELLRKYGVGYSVLLPPEDVYGLFPLNAFPTSYFVDREGVIVCPPIIGALPESYRETFAALLTDGLPQPAANEAGVYRVFVTDADGAPLAGAMVQLCSEALCLLSETDETGCAAFEVEPGVWTAHILRAPAGFAADDAEVLMGETYSDLTVALRAAD